MRAKASKSEHECRKMANLKLALKLKNSLLFSTFRPVSQRNKNAVEGKTQQRAPAVSSL
jgi:hypothetical protein